MPGLFLLRRGAVIGRHFGTILAGIALHVHCFWLAGHFAVGCKGVQRLLDAAGFLQLCRCQGYGPGSAAGAQRKNGK